MPFSNSECSARELEPMLKQMIEQQQTNELLAQLLDLGLHVGEGLSADEIRSRRDKVGAARRQDWE